MIKASSVQIVCFLGLILLGSANSDRASAGEKNAVSADTYKILEQSNAWLKQGKAKQAAQKLQSLQSTTKDNPFETAVVQQYLAYAHAEAGNLWAARQAAQAALTSDLLAPDAVHGLHYLAGQIALRQENYRESATHLEQWLKQEPKAGPEICYLTGYAAYRANLPSASSHLERAIALKKSPPDEWLHLLLSIYIEHKQFRKAEPLVQKLIAAAPKNRKWWLFLSGLYARQNRPDLALSTLMLAYYNGIARKEDIMQLVGFNARQGYPAKAARMLETELERNRIPRSYDNLKLLFTCWQLAREWDKSSQVLTEAATLAPTGEDYALLGQLEMQQGNWSKAKTSLQKGLRKGGLKRKHRARLWLGIAAFKTKDEALARRSLQPLLSEANVKREAAYWLKRLDRSKNPSKNQHRDTPSS